MSESVSQRSSSITLWKSRAASNHPDLISMCLPSPSLSLTRPPSHSHSLHRKLRREQREIKALPFAPDMCRWQREGVIFIICAFFITAQAGAVGELLPFGSHTQIDDGRRIRFKNHPADRHTQTLMHALMHAQSRTRAHTS